MSQLYLMVRRLEIGNEWEVKMDLVRFQLVKSSVNGDELARIIIEVLYRKLDVPQNRLVSAMRDQAPINCKAVSTVSILYRDMMDIGRISNFLDRIGTKFVTQVLSSFM